MNNIPREVAGKWAIIKGTESNPDAVIVQLDPDKRDESISFLVGDRGVLFFLNRDGGLYVGNGDFGFTMNRKME